MNRREEGVDDGAPVRWRRCRFVDALRRRDGSRPVSLRKRSVSHRVPKPDDARIDVSELDEILAIDPVARTCAAKRVVDPHGLVRDLYEKTVLAPRGLSRDGRRP